jgi:hypothetical protein
MQSTLNLKQPDDPHDVLAVAPDAVPVAPTEDELAKLARSFRQPSIAEVRNPSDPPAGPAVDTTFRPAATSDVAVPRRPRSTGRRVARAMTAALLLAACTGGAAIAWQSYGDMAERIIAPWLPQRVLASFLPPGRLPLQAPSAAPATAEAAAADAAAPQPAPAAANTAAPQLAPAAQTAPQGIAPAAAAPSADSTQSLGSIAHDLASVGQQIEQLKASIEELKAGQQQMSRDMAKASEPNLRPKSSAPPPRPAAARARRPMPPQAAAAPLLPPAAAPYIARQPEPQPQISDQAPADPELASVPRPPMPLR